MTSWSIKMQILNQYIFEGVASLFDLHPLPLCHTLSYFCPPPPSLGGDILFEWTQSYAFVSELKKISLRCLSKLKKYPIGTEVDVFGCL